MPDNPNPAPTPETSSAELSSAEAALAEAAQAIESGNPQEAQEPLQEAREILTAAAEEIAEETAPTDPQAQIMAQLLILTERLERLESAAMQAQAATVETEIAQAETPTETAELIAAEVQAATPAQALTSRLKNGYQSPLQPY